MSAAREHLVEALGLPAPAREARLRTLSGDVERLGDAIRADVPGVEELVEAALGAIAPGQLRLLVATARTRRLAGGARLFEEGAPSDALYLVLHGRVEARAGGRTLNVIARGELVGERGVLTGAPRSAAVSALRDTELLVLPGAAMRWLWAAQAGPTPFLHTLARRMAGTVERHPSATTIALLPLRPGLDPRPLAEALVRALPGPATWFDASAPNLPPDRAGRAAWLERREAGHDWVLWVGAADDPSWSEACLRQADRVVVIADASGSPEPGRIDALVAGSGRTAELVLLHAPGAEPRGTARWLDPRPWVSAHLHLPSTGPAPRLARRLSGTEVCLVLSGGAARGFAHLGFVRALQEAGVPIDRVGGTSMGAGIGAGVALGMAPDEVLEGLRRVFVDRPLGRAWTLPAVSLLSAAHIDPELQARGAGRDVEDTWLPFFACSCNLTRSRLEVHDRGSLALAVRASSALPGILPPALRSGEVLVDGGLLDNLPVAPMRRRGRGPVIAVDVPEGHPLRAEPAWTRLPDGPALLARRMNPFARNPAAPTLMEVLTHSLVCAGRRERAAAADAADVLVELRLDGVGAMDFEDCDRIAEQGHRLAVPEMDRVRGALAVPAAPPAPRRR